MNRNNDLAMARRMHRLSRERTMNKPLQLTLSLSIASMCAFAGSVSSDLKALPPSTPVRVMIQFNGTPSNGTLNAIKAEGAVQYREYKTFNNLQGYSMTAGKAAGIAHKKEIRYISLDRSVQKHLDL